MVEKCFVFLETFETFKSFYGFLQKVEKCCIYISNKSSVGK